MLEVVVVLEQLSTQHQVQGEHLEQEVVEQEELMLSNNTAGTANTGGGGGGGSQGPGGSELDGEAGGSGIVIIRYKFQ
jgi:hypothetical protein